MQDTNAFSQLKQRVSQKSYTDSALIEQIVSEQLFPFSYNGELYVYTDGVHMTITKKELQLLVHRILPDDVANKLSINKINQAVDMVFARAEQVTTLPKYPNYINLPNGIFDINSNKLLPHDPKYRMTYILQVDYNPDAIAPKFEDFIKKIFRKRKKLIMHAQEVFGYLIFDYPPLKELLLLKGDSNTGKSVFLSIIRSIVGVQFTNSVSLKDLNNEYYLATLCAKRLNLCGESTSVTLRDLSVVKQLTSPDDAIQVRQIRQETRLVTERPKLVFATNHYPLLASNVENLNAFFNRVHIIPFDEVIPENEQIEGFADTLIKEEGEGIFLWAVEGYKRFLANGGKFTKSNRVLKYQNEYKNAYLVPSKFVNECLEFVPDKKIFTSKLESYIEWFCECLEIDYDSGYLQQVRKILTSHGVQNKKIRKGKKTKQGFYGVKFIYKKDFRKKNLYDFD